MKSCVEKFHRTFESFVESWVEADGSQIHEGGSPRVLLLGRLQTGFSTFLGYCRSNSRDIEKRGGIFGLYVLSSTQFAQYPAPLLISPGEGESIAKFCHEDLECASIISWLIKHRQIAFSAFSMAINTRYAEFPPVVVPKGRISFRLQVVTSRELEERKRPSPEELDFRPELIEYRELMAGIRSELNLDV
jgi:hypothetical protein